MASKHNSIETFAEAQFRKKEVESEVKGTRKKTDRWTIGRSDGRAVDWVVERTVGQMVER